VVEGAVAGAVDEGDGAGRGGVGDGLVQSPSLQVAATAQLAQADAADVFALAHRQPIELQIDGEGLDAEQRRQAVGDVDEQGHLLALQQRRADDDVAAGHVDSELLQA
jgi:hypothetical protein